jgi:hypothetical protein
MYGNHPPTQWLGLPVDDSQAEEVKNYVNLEGSAILGYLDHQDNLANVRSVDFVPGAFVCDSALYGDQLCFGITREDPNTGEATSKVALIVADASQASTTNVGCTALAHELMHTMLWNLTGDADGMHTNDSVWGSEGVVVHSLEHFCPEWSFTPNNLSPSGR